MKPNFKNLDIMEQSVKDKTCFYKQVMQRKIATKFKHITQPCFISQWLLVPLKCLFLEYLSSFFWPRFYIVVLGMTFFFLVSPIYFFQFLFGLLFPFSIWTFISLFYLDIYFPFLFGLLFPFSLWTFILFKFILNSFQIGLFVLNPF